MNIGYLIYYGPTRRLVQLILTTSGSIYGLEAHIMWLQAHKVHKPTPFTAITKSYLLIEWKCLWLLFVFIQFEAIKIGNSVFFFSWNDIFWGFQGTVFGCPWRNYCMCFTVKKSNICNIFSIWGTSKCTLFVWKQRWSWRFHEFIM